MKFLGEMLALLLLFFLFAGEPDVWDRLHDAALKVEICK